MTIRQDSKRYYKVIKYLTSVYAVFLLLDIPVVSQSIEKTKTNSIIKELTPTYPIKENLKNLSIIGFDILDGKRNRLTHSRFKFYPGEQFYIVLYGKKKRISGITPSKNKQCKIKAVFEYQKGGYFCSTNTSYFLGKNEIKETLGEWQIGGVFKIQFSFKVPKLALPGKYKLITVKEKASRPGIGKLKTFNKIKIILKRPKTIRSKINKYYNLQLEDGILNPAIIRAKNAVFLWTGNIKYFLDRDIKNFNKIIISAKGTPARGVYPLLTVYIDKIEIGTVYINSEWNNYEFDLKLTKEAHILKIRFANDYSDNREDRNMYVNMIKLVR